MECGLISEISILLQIKEEYDIIPHLDTPDHTYITNSASAFAVCSCVGSLFWKDLYNQVLNREISQIDSFHFLLLFVPSCLVIWNRIKRLIADKELSLNGELSFTSLILKRNPRSTEALQHRQWIRHYSLSCSADINVNEDLYFCEVLAVKHRCNYAVWDYRRWLLNKDEKIISEDIVSDELKRSHLWLSKHPTDASGWSYRGHLLDLWKDSSDVEKLSDRLLAVLREDSIMIDDILNDCPVNEPVWIYRRMLDSIFVELSSPLDVESFSLFDSFVPAALCLDPLTTDNNVDDKAVSNFPPPFNLPWSSVLYKRHLRWLFRSYLFNFN